MTPPPPSATAAQLTTTSSSIPSRPSAGPPLRVAVVGAGPRSNTYTRFVQHRPGAMQVVAVADPNPVRRNTLADAYGVAPENRFATYEDLAAHPQVADAVFNTTLDTVHYASTIALLRAGFHVLLEKPIAPTETETREIISLARERGRVVMVCHVLRYEPFYQSIKQHIDTGAVGRLISIHTVENMPYDHVATTYLRHPRNLQPAILPMMLSKCCHDLDVIAWLTGGLPLERVASVLKPTQFRPENAPSGSTERCLDGCAVESTCRYSARALYVDDDLWDAYPWPTNEYPTKPSTAEKLRILATSSPYGRCAWRCPSPSVDHQLVVMQFAGGVTASHDLYCATPRAGRSIRILGTDGEIEGDYTSGQLLVRTAVRSAPGRYQEQHVPVAPHDRKAKGPRPCETALVADFIGTVRGDPSAPSLTRIEDSLVGHQIAYAADVAVRERRVVELT